MKKRVAITPEIAKKYHLRYLPLSNNYASHLGFEDAEYKNCFKFSNDEKALIENADIFAQLEITINENLSNLKENQIIIGILNPFKNTEKLSELKKKKLIVFH